MLSEHLKNTWDFILFIITYVTETNFFLPLENAVKED